MLNNRITITRDSIQDDIALRLSFFEKKLNNAPSPAEGEDRLRKELEVVQESIL